jgi:transcriptional regulator with XRE-family HTH domain
MKSDVLLRCLGLALRARREAIGLSQEEFADRIDSNRAYYGDVERGKRNLTVRSLQKIASGLGASMLDVFREAAEYETAVGRSSHRKDERASPRR